MNKLTLYIFFCFIVALTATLGSLFFSEIMSFIPCSLCWYQRIFMYPLSIIFLVNLLYPDNNIVKYALPVAVTGWIISIYHNLIMYGIIPKDLSPCVQGVPCSTKYIDWLGFINIPLLSFIAFSIILILLFLTRKEIISYEK